MYANDTPTKAEGPPFSGPSRKSSRPLRGGPRTLPRPQSSGVQESSQAGKAQFTRLVSIFDSVRLRLLAKVCKVFPAPITHDIRRSPLRPVGFTGSPATCLRSGPVRDFIWLIAAANAAIKAKPAAGRGRLRLRRCLDPRQSSTMPFARRNHRLVHVIAILPRPDGQDVDLFSAAPTIRCRNSSLTQHCRALYSQPFDRSASFDSLLLISFAVRPRSCGCVWALRVRSSRTMHYPLLILPFHFNHCENPAKYSHQRKERTRVRWSAVTQLVRSWVFVRPRSQSGQRSQFTAGDEAATALPAPLFFKRSS